MCCFLKLQWVADPVFHETLLPEDTGVTLPAGITVGRRIVTTARETVVHAQFGSLPNNLCLGQGDERSVNFKPLSAFDRSFGGEVGHPFERFNELGAAVGIA